MKKLIRKVIDWAYGAQFDLEVAFLKISVRNRGIVFYDAITSSAIKHKMLEEKVQQLEKELKDLKDTIV